MTQATTWGVPSSGPVTPTTYATRDNASLDSLLSTNAGTSAPPYAVSGTQWLDTSATPYVLKMYDGTDWLTIATVNASTNVVEAAVPVGSVVKSVRTDYTAYSAAISTAIPLDDTIPQ